MNININIWEVMVDGEYYGTVHTPLVRSEDAYCARERATRRAHELYPKLFDKKYNIVFIGAIDCNAYSDKKKNRV